MKFIILHNEPNVWEKVIFALESTYGITAVSVPTLEAMHASLQAEPISLIIHGHAQVAWEAFQKALPPSFKGFLIVCESPSSSSTPPVNHPLLFTTIERSQLLSQLTLAMGQWLEKHKDTWESTLGPTKESDKYCKIKSRLLLSVCPLKGDIFIRLSEKKFVKLFHQGDAFDLEDMEKYTLKKGIEYLYIQQKDCAEFIQKYQVDLDLFLNQKKSIPLAEGAQRGLALFETVKELGTQFGFGKEVQNMAKSYVQLTLQTMGKSPSLAQFLDKLGNLQGDYLSTHSTLCSYFSCGIASHLDWASEMTFQKLSLASFLHDIIFENSQLAACETLAEVENGPYSAIEKEFYRNHPIQISEIVKKFQEVPPDVDVIIAQHHELPEGKGFPRGLHHQRFAPLTCVFMIAHELTQWMLKIGIKDESQLQTCVQHLKQKYPSSQFRKVLETVEKLNAS